jgi:hypothetical protein
MVSLQGLGRAGEGPHGELDILRVVRDRQVELRLAAEDAAFPD